jgi:IS30 family transposase
VQETKDAVVKALDGLPVKSLSLDNGSEFACFKELEKELKATVYFADPHSPWQRASNENINDLVRFFFPKGTDFHKVIQEELDKVISLINNRPRKCLGWLSPIEFLSRCCT